MTLKYNGEVVFLLLYYDDQLLSQNSHAARIKDKKEYIWHLLDMRVGGIGIEHESDEEGGYLVLMRCDEGDSLHNLWTGDLIKIEPTADCTITLSRVQVT